MPAKLQHNNGYLLVEAMIAISLLTVGFSAVFGLVSNSISLNRVVSDQFTASYLAMEGIEIVKNLIDSNYLKSNPWNQGFIDGSYEVDYKSANLGDNFEGSYSTKRLQLDSDNFYGYQVGDPTIFERTVFIKFNSPNEMKVNSVVKWTGRGGGDFVVNLEDHFFNWR